MNSLFRRRDQTVRKNKHSVQKSLYDEVDPGLLDMALVITDFYTDLSIPSRNHTVQRVRFLSVIDEKREHKLQRLLRNHSYFRHTKQRKWIWQFAVVVVVIAMMLFPLRGQMIVAAQDSLPGDALYLVKLAKEDSAVQVIEKPDIKALLILSFVDERIDEITTLAKEGREIPLTAIYRAHRLLNTALSYASWGTGDDMVNLLEEINQHIQAYIHELESVKGEAFAENDVRLSDMVGRCLRLQLIVTAASMEPEIFRDAYRAGTPEQLSTFNEPLGSDDSLDK